MVLALDVDGSRIAPFVSALSRKPTAATPERWQSLRSRTKRIHLHLVQDVADSEPGLVSKSRWSTGSVYHLLRIPYYR
jgi:hypothetical protein